MQTHFEITELAVKSKNTRPYTLGNVIQTINVPFCNIASAKVGTSKTTMGLNTFTLTGDKSVRFCKENANEIAFQLQTLEWGSESDKAIIHYNKGNTNLIHRTVVGKPKAFSLEVNLFEYPEPLSVFIPKSNDYALGISEIHHSVVIPPATNSVKVLDVVVNEDDMGFDISICKTESFQNIPYYLFNVNNPVDSQKYAVVTFVIQFHKPGIYNLGLPGGIFIPQ